MMGAITMLIQHGHRPSDIADYPVDAFRRYVDAAVELDKSQRIGAMVDMQVTVGSLLHKKNHEAFKEYLEGFTRTG